MKKKLSFLLTMIVMTLSLSFPVCAAENEYDEFVRDNLDEVNTTQSATVICNVEGGWSLRIPKKIYLTVGNDGIATGEYTISVKGIIGEGKSIFCIPPLRYETGVYFFDNIILSNGSGTNISCKISQDITEFRLNSSLDRSYYDEGCEGRRSYGNSPCGAAIEANYESFRGTETDYKVSTTGRLTSNGVVGIGNWTGTLTFTIQTN